MKKLLLVLLGLVFFGIIPISAQQNKIDSLKKELKYKEIVEYIDKLPEQNEDVIFEKAEALRKEGSLSEAIICLEAVCKKSKNSQFFYQLANYYNEIGDKKKALFTLQKIVAFEPTNSLYYEIAKLEYRLRKFLEAKRSCDKVLQQDTIANVLRLQSSCYNAMDSQEEAERLLKRAIARNPKDYLAVEKLSTIYKGLQDYKAILELTDTYLEQDSLNVNILSLNAFANFSLHKYRIAKQQYEKLFEMGLNPAEHYFYLGYACYRLGHANDAYLNLLEANERAQELNEVILYHLGLACIKSLRYEEGIEYLDKALHYYLPDNEKIEDIYRHKSTIYHGLRQETKAIAMLRKGLKYKYRHETLYQIAYLYDVNNREKQAVKAYNHFLKSLPDSLANGGLKNLKRYTEHRLQQIQEKQFMSRDSTQIAQ